MSGEKISFSVEYDVRGVDRSIHSTQRLLYATNALRLSIVDLQRLSSDPSLGNLLWTGIQLTRTWRLLYNLVKATNQAQTGAIGRSVLRGAVGTSLTRGFAAGQTTLTGSALGGVGGAGFGTALLGLAAANPILAGAALVAITVSALGYRKFFMDRKFRNDKREFIQRQRNIAKTQGYEF